LVRKIPPGRRAYSKLCMLFLHQMSKLLRFHKMALGLLVILLSLQGQVNQQSKKVCFQVATHSKEGEPLLKWPLFWAGGLRRSGGPFLQKALKASESQVYALSQGKPWWHPLDNGGIACLRALQSHSSMPPLPWSLQACGCRLCPLIHACIYSVCVGKRAFCIASQPLWSHL